MTLGGCQMPCLKPGKSFMEFKLGKSCMGGRLLCPVVVVVGNLRFGNFWVKRLHRVPGRVSEIPRSELFIDSKKDGSLGRHKAHTNITQNPYSDKVTWVWYVLNVEA